MNSSTLPYRQLGFLGRGGTAEAYLIQSDAHGEAPIVQKKMRQDKKAEPAVLASFEMEAKTLSKLNHPNIVKYLGGEPEKGYILLEYVPGVGVDHLLAKAGRFPAVRVIPLILDLCAALDHVHSRGIIHGDLKPANLVALNPNTENESLKLVDFGFARIDSAPTIGMERLKQPQRISAKGTPSYIAPEILQGHTVDGRADLYSVGVILFELLAGFPPFTEEEMDELLEAHIRREPPKFTQFDIWDIPFEVEKIVQRCLSKYPSERYPSARDLGYALADLAGITWNPDPFGEAETQKMPSISDAPRPGELVYSMEAWMPEPIAVVKLNGFLTDTKCQILRSASGMIEAEYHVKKQIGMFSRLMGKGKDHIIRLEIRLNKPNLYEQLLDIRVKFRAEGGLTSSQKEFEGIAKELFQEMKSFMISRN